MQIAEYLT